MRLVKIKEGRDIFVDRNPDNRGGGYRIRLNIDLLGACIVDWTDNPLTESLVGPFPTVEAAEAELSAFLRRVNGENALPVAARRRPPQMCLDLDPPSSPSN